jgi:hypothetical protein
MRQTRCYLNGNFSRFDAIPESRRAKAFSMNDGGWTAQLENIRKFLSAWGAESVCRRRQCVVLATPPLHDIDPTLHRKTREDVTDNVQLEFHRLLEANASLARVQFPAGRSKRVFDAGSDNRISVHRYQMQGDVALVRSQGCVPERLTIVCIGISVERHLEYNHVPGNDALVVGGNAVFHQIIYGPELFAPAGIKIRYELLRFHRILTEWSVWKQSASEQSFIRSLVSFSECYVIGLEKGLIYVLHAFQTTTRQTHHADINSARERLKALNEGRRTAGPRR